MHFSNCKLLKKLICQTTKERFVFFFAIWRSSNFLCLKFILVVAQQMKRGKKRERLLILARLCVCCVTTQSKDKLSLVCLSLSLSLLSLTLFLISFLYLSACLRFEWPNQKLKSSKRSKTVELRALRQ